MSESVPDFEHSVLDNLEKFAGRIMVGASAAMPGVLLSSEVFHMNDRFTCTLTAATTASYVLNRYLVDRG
jgi:hypothetical protein